MKKFSITSYTTALISSAFILSSNAIANSEMTKANTFEGFHMGTSFGINKANGSSEMLLNIVGNMLGSNNGGNILSKANQDQIGIIGGLNFGYDYFLGDYFVGFEVGGDLSTLKGKRHYEETHPQTLSNNLIKLSMDFSSRFKNGISAGLRAGMLLSNDVLAYGHIDWLGSKFHASNKLVLTQTQSGSPVQTQTAFLVKKTKLLSGARFGLGIAKAVTPQMQIGLDLAYSIYEKMGRTVNLTPGNTTSPVLASFKFKPQTFESRIFMKYKFEGIS